MEEYRTEVSSSARRSYGKVSNSVGNEVDHGDGHIKGTTVGDGIGQDLESIKNLLMEAEMVRFFEDLGYAIVVASQIGSFL